MKRRWRVWLLLTALLSAGAVFLLPAVHWCVIGWARGEAFYQGRPTSYWNSEIQDRYERREYRCHGLDGKCGTVSVYWERQPSAWEQWLDKAFNKAPPAKSGAVLARADEDAVGVLMELFVYSDDLKVRMFVADELSRLGEPSLWEAAESQDESIRRAAGAAWKLYSLNSAPTDP